jgi:hypothetical protein
LANVLVALVFGKCPNTRPEDVRSMITNYAFYVLIEPGLGTGVVQVENTIASACITN